LQTSRYAASSMSSFLIQFHSFFNLDYGANPSCCNGAGIAAGRGFCINGRWMHNGLFRHLSLEETR
jgi:hypothetical protein